MNIQEIRQKYPEYSDLTDKQIADGFHQKFYSDIPIEEFYVQVGLTPMSARERAIDFGKSAASVVPSAASFIAGLPGDIDALGKAYLPEFMTKPIREIVTGKETEPMYIPGSQDIKDYMTSKTEAMPLAQEIINYQPQTAPGRYTKTIGEFAAPGLLAKTKAARQFGTGLGAGGGLLFQGLEDLTDSPGAAAAVTIPSMVVGGILGGPSTAAKLAQTSLKNVSRADVTDAKALEAVANRLGIKLLPGESLKDKSVQSLTADVIASERGSPYIYEATKSRPKAVATASEAQAAKLGPVPESVRSTNQMIAEAARAAMKNARRQRTERATYMGYSNVKGAKLKPEQVQKVINKIDEEIKKLPTNSPQKKILNDLKTRITIPVKKPKEAPEILLPSGRPARSSVDVPKYKPQTSITKLDDAFQEFRDKAKLPPGSEKAIDKKTWYKLFNENDDGILNLLNNEMRTNTNYAKANDLFAQLSDDLVKVVDDNVGALAKNNISDATIRNFVFNPNKANVGDIKKTFEVLNKTNPQAVPEIASLYFRNAIDKAFTLVKQGEDLTQGFNLAKTVVGTGNQRKNFMAVLDGVAEAKGVDPKQLKVGFEKLFSVLERTGKVTNINKPGFQAQGAAARTLIKDAAMMKTFNPFVRLATKYGEMKAGGAMAVLGRIMASDDAVNQLVKLAKDNPQSKAAIIRAVNIIDASQALQNEPDL